MTAARPPDPEMSEAAKLGSGCGLEGEAKEQEPEHSAGTAAAQLKAWSTVQAECLLAGFKADIIEGDDGRPMLVVSRWALTRSFHAPGEARMWLLRVAGGRA